MTTLEPKSGGQYPRNGVNIPGICTYCAEKGINEAKFYYWISRIKEIDKSAVGFLTIDKASKNSDIEIIYPNGVRIKVENDLGLLSQLIRLY